ncbi:MAG: rod shape-determining protein MreC [Deltaproteobacteria bacterium]
MLCLLGAGLMFVPADTTRPVRALVRDALCPGQSALLAVVRCSRAWVSGLGHSVHRADRAGNLDDELQAARLENRRLELQVARLREQVEKLAQEQGLTPAAGSPLPLVTPRLVAARVLGEETAALWRGRKLLSVGAAGEIAESALVLDDARPMVDLGADASLSVGDATYAGRIVIGKIAEIGRYNSTLRLVTDPAYSGRARLARRTSRGLVFGAEGTLVGDGSDLCRLRHIADPVNVGDEVFTGAVDGLIPLPMYYGKVVRAELAPGANEWSVWVKPAANGERLESVLILRRAVNPDRILAN